MFLTCVFSVNNTRKVQEVYVNDWKQSEDKLFHLLVSAETDKILKRRISFVQTKEIVMNNIETCIILNYKKNEIRTFSLCIAVL